MSVVIRVRNLGKCYQIYDKPQHRLLQSLWRGRRRYFREFWAVRDISFEVRKGETVGIVGRNGSGKSTLLQLVTGVLVPTVGSVEVRGRVAALLELGSGFNPEFTGRENVYMNAAILGLSRDETDQRFPEIAAFADIGDFIEQPVKMYSSGMMLRLAFAVAVCVAPDVLIVDEALAVGDEVFQRKCFARIQAIQQSGTAILFVSHSAQAVVELCQKALLLDQGERISFGKPKAVVAEYHKLIFAADEKRAALREALRQREERLHTNTTAPDGNLSLPADSAPVRAYYDPAMTPRSTVSYETRGALIEGPRILNDDGEVVNILVDGRDYCVKYSVRFTAAASNVRFGTLIKTLSGFELGGASSAPRGAGADWIAAGAVAEVELRFRCLLLPGVYFTNLGCSAIVNGEEIFLHRVVDALMFRVQPRSDDARTGVVDFGFESTIMVEPVSSDLTAPLVAAEQNRLPISQTV